MGFLGRLGRCVKGAPSRICPDFFALLGLQQAARYGERHQPISDFKRVAKMFPIAC